MRPAWSPDGRRIAFQRATDWTSWPSQIFVMNVDGSNLHHVSMNSGGVSYSEMDPAWSPDGTLLAYWSSAYGLAIADAGGGTPRSVLTDPQPYGTGSKPAFSPDGVSIAFNTVRTSSEPRGSIMVFSLETHTTQRIIRDAYDASFSPDGKRIVFTSTQRD